MHQTQNDSPPAETTNSLDALLPLEMAKKSEKVGEAKAHLDWISTFSLAILAGAFIAWGAVFSTVVVTGGEAMPFGVSKMLGGLAFSLGLILVIVGGAELFTGNNLIVMAWASRRISSLQLLRNWVIVYAGNFVGAVGVAILVFLAALPGQNGGAVGETILRIGQAKCGIPWLQAVAAGIGCNILVCLAVWLCMSARTVTDKILAIIFPITAFVATGMEHCVANMYFIPMALLTKLGNPEAGAYDALTIENFLVNNLLPVTVGNIIGGTLFVGLTYWFIYVRPGTPSRSE